MTCKERGNLVRKLKYCLQCLSCKTKHYDSKHVCSDKWICKNPSHSDFQKKLHFLVCEPHKTDEDNISLFNAFQTEVLTKDWQRNVFKDKSGFVSRHSTFIGKNKPGKEEDVEGEDCESEDYVFNLPVPVTIGEGTQGRLGA